MCECEYKVKDLSHPGYSLREVDLFPTVGGTGRSFSTRKYLEEDRYEIFDYRHHDVYSYWSMVFETEDIEELVEKAKELNEATTRPPSFEYNHCSEYS